MSISAQLSANFRYCFASAIFSRSGNFEEFINIPASRVCSNTLESIVSMYFLISSNELSRASSFAYLRRAGTLTPSTVLLVLTIRVLNLAYSSFPLASRLSSFFTSSNLIPIYLRIVSPGVYGNLFIKYR